MLEKYRLTSLFAFTAVVVIVAMVSAFAACGGGATEPAPTPTIGQQTTLKFSGAGGTTRVLKFLAAAYTQQHNDLVFEFLSGSGSGGGAKGAASGQLDLGAMSRPPKDSELDLGIAHLGFAEDKVVVVTSPDLSITELTSQQVKDIFLGAITNWSEVGGPDSEIIVLIREEDDSNTKILREGMLGEEGFASGSVVLTSEGDAQAALSSGTNSIGYLAYSGVRLEDLSVHALALDGQDPSAAGTSYPLDTRLLGVAYMPANAAKVQPFLDFITSPEGQALLAGRGVAPVK